MWIAVIKQFVVHFELNKEHFSDGYWEFFWWNNLLFCSLGSSYRSSISVSDL